MILDFYFLIACLLLLCCAFIAWLALKTPKQNDMQHQRILRNIRLFQQRVDELSKDLEQTYITQQSFDAMYSELSRQLIKDIERLEQAPAQNAQRKKKLWWLVPIPLLTIPLYFSIGAYPDWQISNSLASLSDITTQDLYLKKFAVITKDIEKRLEQKPDNVEYRILLARYAMGQKDYEQATAHFSVIAELYPEDAEALALYAQAEYLRAGRKVTATVAEYLDKSLAIDAFQQTALGLVGIYSFESQRYVEAIDAWEKLLAVLPPNSGQSEMIERGLAEAKKQVGMSQKNMASSVAANSKEVSDDGEKDIVLRVSLHESLRDLNKNLSVFVYAKAASGPPMPLAVKKMQVKDLPAIVRLNDSMAMMPQMRLSQYEKVVVGARVSQSGQPVPQSGDWQEELEPLLWQEQVVELPLIISAQVP